MPEGWVLGRRTRQLVLVLEELVAELVGANQHAGLGVACSVVSCRLLAHAAVHVFARTDVLSSRGGGVSYGELVGVGDLGELTLSWCQ
jgi:hypothetical protein